jgi:hypothetical protein
MTGPGDDPLSVEFWAALMGCDLEGAPAGPLQPVRIRDGKITVHGGHVRWRFEPGTRVGPVAEGGRIAFAPTEGGVEVEDDWGKPYTFDLAEDALALLPDGGKPAAMVVGRGKQMELVALRIEEHEPDPLGPRLVDEMRTSEGRAHLLVRHVVKGYAQDEWTAERLRSLESLVCSEPLGIDPVPGLGQGDDWVGWKVRHEVLKEPAADDEALRQRLETEVFAGRAEDGSWDASPLRTAYGVLRALATDVPAGDERVQRAAQWLLDWPEPDGRPGMWLTDERRLRQWDGARAGDRPGGADSLRGVEDHVTEDEVRWSREDPQQQVIPICARHYGGLCDAMMHVTGTVMDALCRCGHAEHSRVKNAASAMLRMGGYFGYFCSCWGILDFDYSLAGTPEAEPDFDDPNRAPEGILATLPDGSTAYDVALRSLPYGYGRDGADLMALAHDPNFAGEHRPWLADTNGWVPYGWRETGVADHYALVGSYWQNADCWAKVNRGLSQLPGWPGTVAAFMGLFQCHLYQTALGTWDQGYPAGLLCQIADMTRLARQRPTDARELYLARAMVLKTVPWLRHNQKEDGLWHHEELPCERGYDRFPCIGPRLASYHVVSVLDEFGLLEGLRPRS